MSYSLRKRNLYCDRRHNGVSSPRDQPVCKIKWRTSLTRYAHMRRRNSTMMACQSEMGSYMNYRDPLGRYLTYPEFNDPVRALLETWGREGGGLITYHGQ